MKPFLFRYKELERIGRNSSIICWILLGAIAYNISTAAIDGVSECIPFKENIAGKFVELCTLPIDSLAEQSKDLEDVSKKQQLEKLIQIVS